MNRRIKGGKPISAGKAVRQAVIRSAVRPVMRPVVRPVVRPAPPVRTVPKALKQAHSMMGKSKYEPAGNIFEQFANSMLAGHEKQAPQMYVQAGRARLLSGQVPAGLSLLKVGLAALISSGNLAQVALIAQRIIAELNSNGMATEAAQIEELLGQFMPAESNPQAAVTPITVIEAEKPAARVLPTNCPSCGGPLLLKEVEWLDENTAECPYCGNGVRTEFLDDEEEDDDPN